MSSRPCPGPLVHVPEPLIDGAPMMSLDLAEAFLRHDRDVAESVCACVLASGRALSASWRARFAGVYMGTGRAAAVRAGMRAALAAELGGKVEATAGGVGGPGTMRRF